MARRGGLHGELEDTIPYAENFVVEPGFFYEQGQVPSKELFVLFEHDWEHQSG
jgi:hypothetical protein